MAERICRRTPRRRACAGDAGRANPGAGGCAAGRGFPVARSDARDRRAHEARRGPPVRAPADGGDGPARLRPVRLPVQDLRGGDRGRGRSRPRQVRSRRARHGEEAERAARAASARSRRRAVGRWGRTEGRGRARLWPRRTRAREPRVEHAPHRAGRGARSPPRHARAGRFESCVRAGRLARHLAAQQSGRGGAADRDPAGQGLGSGDASRRRSRLRARGARPRMQSAHAERLALCAPCKRGQGRSGPFPALEARRGRRAGRSARRARRARRAARILVRASEHRRIRRGARPHATAALFDRMLAKAASARSTPDGERAAL